MMTGILSPLFAFINNGVNNYSGLFVKLTADISVSTMVGSSETHSFQGTFLGNGKTLTFTKGSSESAFNEQYCGVFRYVKDATIRDLKVAGDIYTSQKFAGGLVARPYGATSITNCAVSTVIHSRVNNDGTHGGIVGMPEGNGSLTIVGCYNGRLLTSTNTNNCGGFVGWHNNQTISVSHSLYAPHGSIPSGWSPINNGATFVRGGSPTITNCYYAEILGTAQGTQAFALTTAPANLGEQVEGYGFTTVYENGILFDGKYYIGSPFSGIGTEGNPFIISSTDDWNAFVIYVNDGNTFSGNYVKLTNNISVTTMAGTGDANSFQGTFDGNGKMLTFNKGTAESPFAEDYCAPFRHVKNATIKNLHVAGTIYTSVMKAAGFVGESHGALTLTGCRSSVSINSSKSGDGTHGGFVATLSGLGNAITIDGCVFDGSFATTTGTVGCGGFVGWGVYNKPTISNSLLKPTSVDANMMGSTFARWYTGDNGIYEPIITNCYYVVVDNLPTDQGTLALAYTNAPLGLGALVEDYGFITAYGNAILFDDIYYSAGNAIAGSGTVDDPYLISNTEEWNAFANYVNNGDNFSGSYVKLTENISVSTMVGTNETNSFQGIFLGNNKTLTFTKGSSESAFDEEYCAPFRYVKNATIQNLKVEGNIYTSRKFAAGLVSKPYGTTSITGCHVSTVIYSSVNDDGTHGGFVASPGGPLTIEGCAYTGRLLTNSSTDCCGGFVGWHSGATISIINSLYAPTGNIPEGWTAINDGGTFVRGGNVGDHCYYTETMGTTQGTLVYIYTDAPASLGEPVQEYGLVTAYANGILCDDTYYVVPSGTEDDPYLINNTEDWNLFATFVNNGNNNYSGKFVKLTNDIVISTTVGLRGDKPFSGTFLGEGHTITANISSTTTGTGANEQGVAPFHYINGATIKDLTVAGTIASASYHTGGLVGFADGTNLIEGCVVTATLNISSNYAGGFIGHGLNSNTTIQGCAFAGTINGVDGNRDNIGGIWGWSDSGTPTLKDCLEAGTYTNIASMHPMGLQGAAGTITDCYYVTPQIGSPTNACTISGIPQASAFDTAPDNLGVLMQDYGLVKAYANGILCDGTYYVAPSLPGSGTQSEPYTINNTDEWNLFATSVNNGDRNYNGKYVKLANDIAVSTMVGSSETHSFQGTFLGNNKTLTFTIGSSESAFNEQYCAPFRYTKNATIQNLKVAGDIYTSQRFAAGLVCRPYGTTTIFGCHVSTVIHSSYSGDGTHGGFVYMPNGSLTIEGCAYTGRLLTSNSTTNCGGFVGWHNGQTISISNSLYAPDPSITPADNEETFTNGCATFVRDGNPTITNCYYTEAMGTAQGERASTDATASIGNVVQTYDILTAYSNGILFNGTSYIGCGTGTENDPFLISNTDDWNLFATNVNGGNSYSGKFFKLMNDIEITTMAGTNENNSFQGTFDGNGKTLTFTKGSSESAFGEEYCAPFRYVKNATIRDLKVEGDIYTSQKFAAGLVSRAYGTTNITNCTVGTVIYSSVSGDGTHGGIVAGLGGSATVNITECVYNGRLLTNSGTEDCGGFVGWYSGGSVNVSNSLYIPNGNIPEGWTAINHGATFVRGGNAGNNCCYTETMGTAQGAQVYTTAPENEIIKKITIAGYTVYTSGCTISENEPYVANVPFTLTVKDPFNVTLTIGTDYTISLDGLVTLESWPISVNTGGTHRLTFVGMGDYQGTKTIEFSVVPTLNGSGTEDDPYIIANNNDWEGFVYQVNNVNNNYSGKFVRLDANIEISQTVGLRGDKPFSGTFLGNGHTITASISSTATGTGANVQGVAPFHYVNGATIKDLTVAGTIASASYHTGGLVGFADGTNLIENCVVTATLNISSDYAGGFIGHGLNSNTTIRGCVFAGTINGVDQDRENIGGIWGWSDSGTPTLKDCIEAGTYNANIASMHPMGLQKNAGTITNCYYLTPQIGSPRNVCTVSGAKQRRTITAGDGVTVEAISLVGSSTATYNVSGITAYDMGIIRGETFYYGKNDQVSLTLSGGTPGDPQPGYSYGYFASAGTLTGTENPYTLTLPDADVTISYGLVVIDWAGTGEMNDPYIIMNSLQLDLLATRVNNGNDYRGKYFKLGADITYSHTTEWNDASSTENNYTAIGCRIDYDNYRYFNGDFDGNGHTISGIRIYKDGDHYEAYGFVGLFGSAGNGANIHGITIADTRITGYDYAGGIAGFNNGTITDCQVTANVAIHAVRNDAYDHGGIAGFNYEGTISHCTSSAILTIDNPDENKYYGAICGGNYGGTLSDNLVIGATVPAADYNTHGAICGDNYGGTAQLLCQLHHSRRRERHRRGLQHLRRRPRRERNR